MARQKKPVHRVQMTEGKEILFASFFKSMIFKLQKTFRMLSKIFLAEQSKK